MPCGRATRELALGYQTPCDTLHAKPTMSAKSLKNLSGKWSQSRALSSDVQPVMKIQGFNYVTRITASKAPITLNITQISDAEIHIKQSTVLNLPSINEEWYLHENDWREQKDAFMGKVRSRSRWCKVSEVNGGDGFLTDGLDADAEVIEAVVEGLGSVTWKATQVWCFEGEKFVRRVVTEGKNGEKAEVRLVYEFQG
jgi:hypothetical protein